MKMSILIGVVHMNLGIIMSLFNNNYFRSDRGVCAEKSCACSALGVVGSGQGQGRGEGRAAGQGPEWDCGDVWWEVRGDRRCCKVGLAGDRLSRLPASPPCPPLPTPPTYPAPTSISPFPSPHIILCSAHGLAVYQVRAAPQMMFLSSLFGPRANSSSHISRPYPIQPASPPSRHPLSTPSHHAPPAQPLHYAGIRCPPGASWCPRWCFPTFSTYANSSLHK